MYVNTRLWKMNTKMRISRISFFGNAQNCDDLFKTSYFQSIFRWNFQNIIPNIVDSMANKFHLSIISTEKVICIYKKTKNQFIWITWFIKCVVTSLSWCNKHIWSPNYFHFVEHHLRKTSTNKRLRYLCSVLTWENN